MPKQMNKSQGDYLTNEGWSSKLFVRHAKAVFAALSSTVDIKIGRTVIHMTSNGVTIKAFVHHNGRSNEYMTLTDTKGNELNTYHYTEPPQAIVARIRQLLSRPQ